VIGVLIVAGMLSGCAGKSNNTAKDDGKKIDQTTPGNGTSAQLMPMMMDVHDCKFVMAVVPVDPAKVAPYLPTGFTPISASELGIPGGDERGKALLGLEVETCGKVRQPDGTYTTGPTGSYWIPVHPTDAMKKDGVEFNVVKLEVLAWNEMGVK